MPISNVGSISTIINLVTVLVNFNGTESKYHISLSKPQNMSTHLDNSPRGLAGRKEAIVLYPSSYDLIFMVSVNYRVLKGAASHFIAKTCITDM